MTSAQDSPRAPLLALRGLHKRYGGVRALSGADLTIDRAGVVHGLLGENGSGKSTLLGILSGQQPADAGTVALDGTTMRFGSPSDAIRAGIAMVSQETALAPELSVAENIFLGGRMARTRTGVDWGETRRRAQVLTERLGLDVGPAMKAGALAPDQQQQLEIARALSLDARIVILDEPTSSLTDDEVGALFATIARLKGEGVAFVFVSHRIPEMLEVADELTILRDGVTAAAGPIEAFDADGIVEAMVGEVRRTAPVVRRPPPDGADASLAVRGLSIGGVLHDVDVDVAPGEIVGLAGLMGAGRSELLEAIFGARRFDAGSVAFGVGGERRSATDPIGSIGAGVGYLPADRKVRGLVLKRRVGENILMARTRDRPRLGLRRGTPQDAQVLGEVVSGLRVRAASPAVATSTLSGGNQQKVALGKWVATSPRVMLLDEPTRGVDVAAKVEIHDHLRRLAHEGVAMLVSSSENEELLRLCDRILVMARGRIVASVPAAGTDERTLTRLGGGHA